MTPDAPRGSVLRGLQDRALDIERRLKAARKAVDDLENELATVAVQIEAWTVDEQPERECPHCAAECDGPGVCGVCGWEVVQLEDGSLARPWEAA